MTTPSGVLVKVAKNKERRKIPKMVVYLNDQNAVNSGDYILTATPKSRIRTSLGPINYFLGVN